MRFAIPILLPACIALLAACGELPDGMECDHDGDGPPWADGDFGPPEADEEGAPADEGTDEDLLADEGDPADPTLEDGAPDVEGDADGVRAPRRTRAQR